MARILATPLFVTFFLDGSYLAALSLFFFAGVTDALDGFLARVLNQRSALGAILDPLADKILLDTAFVCLANAGWISNWLAVAVVSRDLLILGGVALLTFWGRDMRASINPSLASKATTVFQMAMVLAAYVNALAGLGWENGMGLSALAWATAGLTLASGAHYVAKGLAMFTNGSTEE